MKMIFLVSTLLLLMTTSGIYALISPAICASTHPAMERMGKTPILSSSKPEPQPAPTFKALAKCVRWALKAHKKPCECKILTCMPAGTVPSNWKGVLRRIVKETPTGGTCSE